jgi:hypothetical protein
MERLEDISIHVKADLALNMKDVAFVKADDANRTADSLALKSTVPMNLDDFDLFELRLLDSGIIDFQVAVCFDT